MKRYLFLITIISIGPFQLKAHDYQTVYRNRNAYFAAYSNDFIALVIDSTSYKTDTILYPNKSLEYEEGYFKLGPSWAGNKIIIRDDGINIYFNHNNDSIVINTQAQLNEKWTAFQYNDSVSISAEVTAWSTGLILGLEDSIKTITFQLQDKYRQPINHHINTIQLELSKHYGWKTACTFNLFPDLEVPNLYQNEFNTLELIGLSNPEIGIQNLDWSDIYDFVPGDIIHEYVSYYNCCGGQQPCIHYSKRNTYKYLERTNFLDSIVYLIAREIHSMTDTFQDTISTEIIRDTIRNTIKSNPQLDAISGELCFSKDSTKINTYRQFRDEKWEYKTLGGTFYSTKNDSLWRMLMVDGVGLSLYIKGLGGPYYSYNETCEGALNEVQYYRKGNHEWGTEFDFTGIEENPNIPYVKIYPNPGSNTIFIETPYTMGLKNISLYSADGKEVLLEQLMDVTNVIDITKLKQGIYLYVITTYDNAKISGKLTIKR